MAMPMSNGIRARRPAAPRGFSSVEFIGAVVISMVLSVIAVAGYRIYQRDLPLREGARRLAHTFSTARAFAISNNSVYTVQIDRQYHNFWIDETNAVGVPILPKVTRPEPLDDRVRINDILFGANSAVGVASLTPVRFFSDGSSDDVRVFMNLADVQTTDSASICTVRLYGPTGQSRIFEGEWLLPPAPLAP
jgi:Tfp pilus assembly protein FimT